jgi:hypothetical protein
MSAIGAAYTSVYCGAASYRGVQDEWNSALAGGVGGALLGLSTRSIWRVGMFGAGSALIMWFFDRVVEDSLRVQGLNQLERSEMRSNDGGFFAIAPRNPFAGMWKGGG